MVKSLWTSKPKGAFGAILYHYNHDNQIAAVCLALKFGDKQ